MNVFKIIKMGFGNVAWLVAHHTAKGAKSAYNGVVGKISNWINTTPEQRKVNEFNTSIEEYRKNRQKQRGAIPAGYSFKGHSGYNY